MYFIYHTDIQPYLFTMKRASLYLLFILLSFSGFAQTLSTVCIKASNDNAYIRYIEIREGNAILRVDAEGNAILKGAYGTSNLEYYSRLDGLYNIGKLKSIGDTRITYYDRFDGTYNIGKLKSVGKLSISYYDRFDGPDNVGKLKTVGGEKITYYDRFDDFGDNTGKLKSIGNATITYFSRFDGSQNRGKLKSINGDNPYLYIEEN
jgi:hypothetical protein